LKHHGRIAFVIAVLTTVDASANPPPSPPTAPPPPAASTTAPDLPSAGGLTAPGPIPEEKRGKKSETQQKLDKSREKDSRRGLTWFWLNIEGGFQHMGLETFEVDKSNLTAALVPTEASGGYIGTGLGVSLFNLVRIGPRGRIGFFKNWQMFSVGGEVGFRIPLGMFEPHIDLGGGYVALGNLSDALAALKNRASIRGGYFRIGGGLDIFIGKVFSIGPSVSWELTGMARAAVTDPDPALGLTADQKRALETKGSGYGSVVTIGLNTGVSF
jgi:hypothetical protein